MLHQLLVDRIDLFVGERPIRRPVRHGVGEALLTVRDRVSSVLIEHSSLLHQRLRNLGDRVEEPLRRIAENAGVEGSIVVNKVKSLKGANGFNARTETYEDLIKAGVIDPTKVVRTALQNAASVSGLLLTTEAIIAEKPEEGGGGGGMPGGMPGGMGGMPGMM